MSPGLSLQAWLSEKLPSLLCPRPPAFPGLRWGRGSVLAWTPSVTWQLWWRQVSSARVRPESKGDGMRPPVGAAGQCLDLRPRKTWSLRPLGEQTVGNRQPGVKKVPAWNFRAGSLPYLPAHHPAQRGLTFLNDSLPLDSHPGLCLKVQHPLGSGQPTRVSPPPLQALERDSQIWGCQREPWRSEDRGGVKAGPNPPPCG